MTDLKSADPKRSPAFFLLAVWLTAATSAASGEAPPLPSYDELVRELEARAGLEEDAARRRSIDELWDRLAAHGQIPFREGNRVAFLYRDEDGDALEVAWRGDMTDWQVEGTHLGRRLGRSSVWIVEDVLPADARIDYKLFLDGRWQLDSANPMRQVGGFGPNSELRMPEYAAPPEVEEREGVARGTLGPRERIVSQVLGGGYEVFYRVYRPAGYGALERGEREVPAVYFADGHEYAHPEMGRVTTVLDNRIADGTLPPLVAVLIDPREPGTEENRRLREYGDEPAAYARFLATELVPAVDRAYRTAAVPSARVVVGDSLGGLFAAHVVFHHSDVFGGALAQSPAFDFDFRRHGDRLRRGYRTGKRRPVRIFLHVGTIFDGLGRTREFRDLLLAKGYELRYVEVNEGHSWGHWRAWIDDGLAFLLGGADPGSP